MRRALLLVCLAACGPRLATQAPLVDAPPTLLALTAPQLTRGEEMAWDIYWQGLLVGRAELSVAAREADSRFSTTVL